MSVFHQIVDPPKSVLGFVITHRAMFDNPIIQSTTNGKKIKFKSADAMLMKPDYSNNIRFISSTDRFMSFINSLVKDKHGMNGIMSLSNVKEGVDKKKTYQSFSLMYIKSLFPYLFDENEEIKSREGLLLLYAEPYLLENIVLNKHPSLTKAPSIVLKVIELYVYPTDTVWDELFALVRR